MKCKYCGKDHSHIGMTIIPHCVDELIDSLRSDNKRLREVVSWIASQENLFFAECSQAEEIVTKCNQVLSEKLN